MPSKKAKRAQPRHQQHDDVSSGGSASPPSPNPHRASVAELEQGLAQLRRRDSAGSHLPSTSSAPRRRTGGSYPAVSSTPVAAVRGDGTASTAATTTTMAPQQQQQQQQPPVVGQHVDRSTRPTRTPPGADGTSEPRASRVIAGPTQRLQSDDPAVAALAGGRLPRTADGADPVVAGPRGSQMYGSRHGNNRHGGRDASGKHNRGKSDGDRAQLSLWHRLRGLFTREKEFADFASSNDNRGSVRPWQMHVAGRLDRTQWLPGWMKRATFDTLDLLTRKRVYAVLGVVIVAVLISSATSPATRDALAAMSKTFIVDDAERPGLMFFEKFNNGSPKLPRKHPVAIIPGFITGALEVWESKGTCLDRQKTMYSSFRQHMFGPQMIFLLLSDPACWLELFSTDKVTGMDKNGIKVRADTGFTAVDYFVPGYWVWAKVLINLADIGYDPQSMAVLTYDWRLSPTMAHERDGIFYSVRNTVKFLCQKNRQRAVVISHSYGTTVALAFFKWSEQREPGFMNKYVAYYVNIGGTSLGIPKAASAMLQGDVRDTLMIPSAARKVFDTFMSQSSRFNLTRSWSCLAAMLPRGCEAAVPRVFTRHDGSVVTMHEVYNMIIRECARTGHTNCVKEVMSRRDEADELPVLPRAPNTTVLCLYGVNKSAEVGYILEDPRQRRQMSQDRISGRSLPNTEASASRRAAGAAAQEDDEDESGTEADHVYDREQEEDYDDSDCDNSGDDCDEFPAPSQHHHHHTHHSHHQKLSRAPAPVPAFAEDVARYQTNMSYHDVDSTQGVRLGDGDGTVPLGSLAYMCRAPNGWRKNVGHVVTVEFPHAPEKANPLNLRGDSISGDHVDILGNFELLETLLKVVSGVHELGAQPGQDEVEWFEPAGSKKKKHQQQRSPGQSSNSNSKASERWSRGGTHHKLHRRVTDQIYSNIDELIRTNMSSCLAKPNKPIQPKPPRDDIEFL